VSDLDASLRQFEASYKAALPDAIAALNQLAEAFLRVGEATFRFAQGYREVWTLIARRERREQARRALGYSHEPSWTPRWVRDVHQWEVETFASGNGRID
jgi:hypothetical protein